MKKKARKASQALEPPPAPVGRPKKKICLKHAVKLVIVNKNTHQEALFASQLDGQVSVSALNRHVKKARKEGIYDDMIQRMVDARVGTTVEQNQNNISPLTSTTSHSRTLTTSSLSIAASSASTKKTRNTPRQASVAKLKACDAKLENQSAYKLAFKEATTIVAETINKHEKREESVPELIERLNEEHGLNKPGQRKLAKTTIYQSVKRGMAGNSPLRKGPTPKIPSVLLEVVATHIQVAQVSDGELGGKDIQRVIAASTSGTDYDGKFTTNSVWKKLRRDYPSATQAANKLFVEDARAEWTTHSNLSQWFDDAKGDLIRSGLVLDRPVTDNNGNILSEVDFHDKTVTRRIINMDETHHDLSITGENGGPRSTVYHNPAFQRGGKRAMKSSRHVTGVYATNAAGEALPPMYIFDSTAKHAENYRVNVKWLKGLPIVSGKYGFQEPVEHDSFSAVRSKGSMDDSLLNKYIRQVILPLYPNISKTAIFDERGCLVQGPVILKVDSGPGRMVSSLESNSARKEFYERGLIILLGLPNATSVQQEMDALYGPFKAATYARGEMIVAEKLKDRAAARSTRLANAEAGQHAGDNEARPDAIVSLGFSDLPTVVNGKKEDTIDQRPFDKCFTKEGVLKSWAKIGFVPFTRKCLSNKNVRKELGQHGGGSSNLHALQTKYNNLREQAKAQGLNQAVFDGQIHVAQQPRRLHDEEEAVKKLVEQKGAFSSSAAWNICGSRVCNSGVILRAQQIQLEKEAEKNTKAIESKQNRTNKSLEKAQVALNKYNTNVSAMKDADWIDIIRWVLAESKCGGYLKDYKKKEAIIAKLESLKKPWESYIPTPGVSPVASID